MRLVAVLVAAFILFLVVKAPASLVAGMATDAAPALTMDGISGTAWHGRAAHARWRGEPLGALEWTLTPLALFAGRARARVTLGGAGIELDTEVAHGLFDDRASVTGADGTLSLALLSRISGASGPLEAQAQLSDVDIAIDGDRVTDASGRVTLVETVVTRPQRTALGTFTLDLDAVDGWLVAAVRDDGGPLGVTGTVRAAPDRRWAVDARVRAREPQSDLGRVLALFAAPGDDGAYPLQLSGRY